MNSYLSLLPLLILGEQVDFSQELAPVEIGEQFKFNSRNCMVTKLLPNCFEYEYVNTTLRNDKVNSMRITYAYWSNNVVRRERGITLH